MPTFHMKRIAKKDFWDSVLLYLWDQDSFMKVMQ